MQRKNIYKLKELKFKKSFNLLLLFISLSFISLGCIQKEKININDPLLVKLIYPKTVKQGAVLDIKVKLTNRGIYPIAITNIQIGQPRTSINFKGTVPLKALSHKFKKNDKFKRKFFLDKKIAKRREHVVPEVHKLKAIVYPGQTKIYTVKVIAQSIDKDIYKNQTSVIYINFDKYWHKKLYLFVGRTAPQKDTLVEELYTISKGLPSKLEGNLVSSNDLGKVKYKTDNISIKLKGWNLKDKKIQAMESVFFSNMNSWLYYDGLNTFLAYKDGKLLDAKKVNMVRVFAKAILRGKTKKIFISNTDYKELKEEINKYKFILNKDYFEGYIKLEQLNDFFAKIYSKGFVIHKHGNIVRVK